MENFSPEILRALPSLDWPEIVKAKLKELCLEYPCIRKEVTKDVIELRCPEGVGIPARPEIRYRFVFKKPEGDFVCTYVHEI